MPLGIGNDGWDTPKGTTKVVRKKKNPTWYVPQSVREQDPDLVLQALDQVPAQS